MNRNWNQFASRLLDVLLVIVCAAEILMPFILKDLLQLHGWRLLQGTASQEAVAISEPEYAVVLVLTMLCGLFSILILIELRRIMKTVREGHCFVEANVISLHRMGCYALTLAGLILLRCLLCFTLTMAVCCVVFLIGGSFCFVLEQVFRQAVHYKEEDDLTI